LSAVVPPEAIGDSRAKACTSRNHTHEYPVERKRGFYVRLMPVQEVQIVRHAFAFGNQAANRRYVRQFCTEIKDSSVSTWKAKCVAEMNHREWQQEEGFQS